MNTNDKTKIDLIIFAILIATITSVFFLYIDSKKANRPVIINEELTIILQNTKETYDYHPSEKLNNKKAVTLNIFPDTLSIENLENGQIYNTYGGKVTIKGHPSNSFSITYANIPKGKDCGIIIKNQQNSEWYYVTDGKKTLYFEKELNNSEINDFCNGDDDDKIELTLVHNNQYHRSKY